MRLLADALRLPLRAASVDLIVSNPPYPGNGVWSYDYTDGLRSALAECCRVLRKGRRGWFLLKHKQGERWFSFNRHGEQWEHPGWSIPATSYDLDVNWGTVPDDQVAPLVLAHSVPGDVVLDPFAGRGGIPALAARLGRAPVGVDIDAAQFRAERRY